MIVGRGDDSKSEGLTWNIIITRVCILLLFCTYWYGNIGMGKRSLEVYIDNIQMVFRAQKDMLLAHTATTENKNQH